KPAAVADAGVDRQWVTAVLDQPAFDVEVVVLLAPQHACQGLPGHSPLVLGEARRYDQVVELVSLRSAPRQQVIEVGSPKSTPAVARPRPGELGVCQAEPYAGALSRTQREHVVGCGLGARRGRVDRVRIPMHHVPVDAVLDVLRVARTAED